MIIFRILLLSILFIAFCHFLSLIKRNPIGSILVTWSQLAFREDLFHYSVFVSIPGIIPTSAHI